MTKEEVIKELSKLIFELGFEDNVDDKVYALNMAIKALEQEPITIVRTHFEELPTCGDAISRKAVLEIVNNPLNIRLDEIIRKLPSVTPSRPKVGKDINIPTTTGAEIEPQESEDKE